jgi:DNA mismatch repair protein MutS
VSNQSLSILWPVGYAVPVAKPLSNNVQTDLALAVVVAGLDWDGKHSRFITETLAAPSNDPKVINYRQDILADLLNAPELSAKLTEIVPPLGKLATFGRGGGWEDDSVLLQVAHRLSELEHYVNCVARLSAIFETATVQAEGLLALQKHLAAVKQEEVYQKLIKELPELRSRLEQVGSITVGINLDGQMRPDSATLISVNPGRFSGKGGLLERLLGDWANNNALRGISSLYRAEETRLPSAEHGVFREMNQLLERVAKPIARILAAYTNFNSAFLTRLEPELAFYLGAVKLIKGLKAAGLAFCRPAVMPQTEQICEINGLYCLDLALRLRSRQGDKALADSIVPNNIDFGAEARIFVLTGPNSGGKTTFTRAVGEAQLLFQAGLFVPGNSARISPVELIVTHFATAERLNTNGGRLAEELERLAELFKTANRYSLILLNEPLASTDHLSAQNLSREILAGLKMLGASTLYVTHLHELVADSAALNGDQAVSVVSLVAGVTPNATNGQKPLPNYTIERGQSGMSGYATELARKYGLSFSQISATLKERGIVKD